MKITKLIYDQATRTPGFERAGRRMALECGDGQIPTSIRHPPTSISPSEPHRVWVCLANHLGYTIPK